MANVMDGIINFLMVSFVFIVLIGISLALVCKNFKLKDENIKIYGLLLNLDNVSLLSISALTINYFFILWCLISFSGVNVIYIAITMILTLFSEAVLDNFKKLPISLILCLINCLFVHAVYLLYNYVINENFTLMLLIFLFLFILFVFLYNMYNFVRSINNIVTRNKRIKKNYKI